MFSLVRSPHPESDDAFEMIAHKRDLHFAGDQNKALVPNEEETAPTIVPVVASSSVPPPSPAPVGAGEEDLTALVSALKQVHISLQRLEKHAGEVDSTLNTIGGDVGQMTQTLERADRRLTALETVRSQEDDSMSSLN